MLVGTFVEEVLSPIPAFAVLVPAGAAANVQDRPLWFLGILTVCCGIGRALGACLMYWLANKFENVILGKGRSFFGATHKDVEELGKRLTGKPARDWSALFLMTAIPIFPGAFLSLACGFIKMRFDLFITATFAGTMVSGLFFLSIGYFGLQTLASIKNVELASQIVGGILLVLLIVWAVKKYRAKK